MASSLATDDTAPTTGAFSDKILLRLARKIGDEWKDIGIELDFTMTEIDQIRAEVPQQETNYVVAVTFKIFRKWRSRYEHFSDEKKYNMLREAFQQVDKQSLVCQLEELVDISPIKAAGNMQLRHENEIETLKQEMAHQKANHKQSDSATKQLIEDMKKSLILKLDKQKAQLQKEKQRHSEIHSASDTFASLTDCILHIEKRVDLNGDPWSLCLINNKLYCCEQLRGIDIYTTDLEHVRNIPAGEMKYVYGVAGLSDHTLAVAADAGLFHVANDGKVIEKIDGGFHFSVRRDRNTIIAATWNPPTITTYSYKPCWKKTNTTKLPCDDAQTITLALTDDVIYACCFYDGIVYVISRSNGTVLNKYGRRGRARPGELDLQRACDTDSAGDLLVCDNVKSRLQIMHRNGEWDAISWDETIEQPTGAVLVNNKLYVATAEKKLLMLAVPLM